MGCGLCEVYCQVEHSRSRDVLKAFKKERRRPLPLVRVGQGAHSFVAVQCQHCAEPWCVYACLTGALSKDPISGVVEVDRQRCVGCWTCVMACPFGAITPDIAEGAIAKCDLCPGLSVPACVAGCPNGALVFVDEAEQAKELAAVLAGQPG